MIASSSKLFPVVLGVGTLACVALAATVSVTPPSGAGRVVATPAPCTSYSIESARHTVSGVARERALVRTVETKATDFVSAMQLIEGGRNPDDNYWLHRNAQRDEAIALLARCGQPTQVDRCLGYDPPSASNLERSTSWETTTQWRSRVEKARAEAALCNVALPEAVDPGPDCSSYGVGDMRERAAAVLREIQIDQLTDTDLPAQFRVARLARRHDELQFVREELTGCGIESIDDPCFGVDIETLQIEVNRWRRYADEMKAKHRVDEYSTELSRRAEYQLALCSR